MSTFYEFTPENEAMLQLWRDEARLKAYARLQENKGSYKCPRVNEVYELICLLQANNIIRMGALRIAIECVYKMFNADFDRQHYDPKEQSLDTYAGFSVETAVDNTLLEWREEAQSLAFNTLERDKGLFESPCVEEVRELWCLLQSHQIVRMAALRIAVECVYGFVDEYCERNYDVINFDRKSQRNEDWEACPPSSND